VTNQKMTKDFDFLDGEKYLTVLNIGGRIMENVLHNSRGLVSNEVSASKLLATVPVVMQSIRVQMRRSVRTDLTVPQFRILARLSAGASNPCELADWIGVSVPAISRINSLLEKKNMIRKVQQRLDRRQFKLSLTAKGRRCFEKSRQIAADAVLQRLENLNHDEKVALNKGLDILQNMFSETEEPYESRASAQSRLPGSMGLRARANFKE
jgi:DNA-binding MarR family transcriptional regulator